MLISGFQALTKRIKQRFQTPEFSFLERNAKKEYFLRVFHNNKKLLTTKLIKTKRPFIRIAFFGNEEKVYTISIRNGKFPKFGMIGACVAKELNDRIKNENKR